MQVAFEAIHPRHAWVDLRDNVLCRTNAFRATTNVADIAVAMLVGRRHSDERHIDSVIFNKVLRTMKVQGHIGSVTSRNAIALVATGEVIVVMEFVEANGQFIEVQILACDAAIHRDAMQRPVLNALEHRADKATGYFEGSYENGRAIAYEAIKHRLNIHTAILIDLLPLHISPLGFKKHVHISIQPLMRRGAERFIVNENRLVRIWIGFVLMGAYITGKILPSVLMNTF